MDNNNNQQPQMPTPPVGQPAPYQMPPKKGLSKGALWGIIGGSIGLVVVIIGIVLAIVLLGGPTKEDYRTALGYMQNADIQKVDDLLGNDSEDAEKKTEEFITKVNGYFDKLGAEKAMRDGEVKKAFEAYKQEWENSKPIFKSLVAVAASYNTVRTECKSSYVSYVGKTGEQYGAEFDSKNKECLKALESVKNSSISEVSDYAKEQINYIKELRAYGVAMANRSANKDYSSPSPTFPKYPSSSSLSTALMNEQKKIKLDDRERDLMTLLSNKANAQ